MTYRDARYAGPGLQVGDEWWEEIGPVGNDRHLLELAHGAVENHTAAWLVYFTTGHLPGLWKPPTIVQALGLEYQPRRGRTITWQCEGMALIEAEALTETLGDAAETIVTDYRVEGARVMRLNSASAQRAARWCAEYERRQDTSGRHDRPPDMSDYTARVQREVRSLQVKSTRKRAAPAGEDDPFPLGDEGTLAWYRRAMFNESEAAS
jgi:hypothetical protein